MCKRERANTHSKTQSTFTQNPPKKMQRRNPTLHLAKQSYGYLTLIISIGCFSDSSNGWD